MPQTPSRPDSPESFPPPLDAAVPARAETWPGPATPLRWLGALALTGAVVGAVVGALAGATAGSSVTATASVEAVPDSVALSGPLDNPQQQQTQLDTFVASELSWLQYAQARQSQDSPVALAVSQVGTSDVLQISGTATRGSEARAAVDRLLDAYVARRQDGANTALQQELTAVQGRLDAIGNPGSTSPQAAEVQRLLTQQSDLQTAQSRVPAVAPVLHRAADQDSSGAPKGLLYGILGAIVGAVLALAGGALWRGTSKRLFDARLLVAAGVTVLLPRLPAGRARGRGADLPGGQPGLPALGAARALLPQVLGPGSGPRTVLVLGADERAGAADVAWELGWALSTAGTPVTVLTTGGAVDERTLAPALVTAGVDAGEGAVAIAVDRAVAAGRTVLLVAPALSAGLRFPELAEQADRAVVVVGEGVSTLEGALAAVRNVTAAATPLAGVAVTTSRRTGATPRAAAGAHRADQEPAEETTTSRPEPVSSEV